MIEIEADPNDREDRTTSVVGVERGLMGWRQRLHNLLGMAHGSFAWGDGIPLANVRHYEIG